MVSSNLKRNSVVVLCPGGLSVENFETGVMRGAGGLLCGEVGSPGNGETPAWRGKFWPRKGRRWGWGFGLSQRRWHASEESSSEDKQGHLRDEFEWCSG